MLKKKRIVFGVILSLIIVTLLLLGVLFFWGSALGRYYNRMDVIQYKLNPLLEQVLEDEESKKGNGILDDKYQEDFLLFENPKSLILIYRDDSIQKGRLSLIYHKDTEKREFVMIYDVD